MSAPVTLSEDEFVSIEDAIASTARGRAFLRMREQRQRVVALEEVRRMTHSIKDWVVRRMDHGNDGAHIAILRRELQEMGAYIQKTRSELASLRSQADDRSSGNSRINLATEELDEIVRSTERATSDILNAAERIFALAGGLGGDAVKTGAEITDQATEILTACSFQDLTGQRISKVINTLRYLERRVNAMIEIWGIDDKIAAVADDAPVRPDGHLLNGPARPGEGKSQSEIDAILNGLVPSGAKDLLGTAADAPTPAAGQHKAPQSEIDKLFP